MQTQPRKLFLNLPVRDLTRTIAFFEGLGFTFNPQFTDDKCTCMIISDEAYAMLMLEDRYMDFAKKPACDPTRSTPGIFALSANSRREVDEVVASALATGGSHAADPIDLGFMYGRSFYDPDGYHWEVIYLDPSATQP